jgi:hypothetical protein
MDFEEGAKRITFDAIVADLTSEYRIKRQAADWFYSQHLGPYLLPATKCNGPGCKFTIEDNRFLEPFSYPDYAIGQAEADSETYLRFCSKSCLRNWSRHGTVAEFSVRWERYYCAGKCGKFGQGTQPAQWIHVSSDNLDADHDETYACSMACLRKALPKILGKPKPQRDRARRGRAA